MLPHEENLTALCERLPVLKAKCIVDFANGIDVANDHIRVQKMRSGFRSRLLDVITGDGHRRQGEINQNLLSGIEGALNWLNHLTETQTEFANALKCVNKHISDIYDHITNLAHFSDETRRQINDLQGKFSSLYQEVHQQGLEVRAERQINHLFGKWEAGGYANLPPASRFYVVLESLYFGNFGLLYSSELSNTATKAEFKEMVINKAKIQFKKDINEDGRNSRPSIEEWMMRDSPEPLMCEALQYLGDWVDKDNQPFSYGITQGDLSSAYLPRLSDSKRIADALTFEILEER